MPVCSELDTIRHRWYCREFMGGQILDKELLEEMQEQQERMLAERKINLALLEQGTRPPLPKTLVSAMERIQKCIN